MKGLLGDSDHQRSDKHSSGSLLSTEGSFNPVKVLIHFRRRNSQLSLDF